MTPSSLAADVVHMLDRDLRALQRELEAYPEERQLWQPIPGVGNSAGTLALHLTGNLQHYFGACLGGTGYVRDRDAEFGRRDVSRAELIAEIDRARTAVRVGAASIDDAAVAEDFPEPVAQARVRTGDYLVHLCVHFGYHLGQIDLHRRVVTGKAEGIGAVRPAEMRSARPEA
jgi:uncharacterized damage-inducible protein DinB